MQRSFHLYQSDVVETDQLELLINKNTQLYSRITSKKKKIIFRYKKKTNLSPVAFLFLANNAYLTLESNVNLIEL